MRQIICLLAALLGACTVQAPPTNDQASAANEAAVAPNEAPVSPPPAPVSNAPTSTPASTDMTEPASSAPPPREVVSEAPFSPTSAQGAADVVRTYYALIEAKKYVAARKLWGSSSDLADATFAARFDRYRDYHAEVDAPGRVEGAAGSSYVEVPVRTYGLTTAGKKFEERLTVTLRRVNDVPGSTAEQRRWHITKIDTPASPH